MGSPEIIGTWSLDKKQVVINWTKTEQWELKQEVVEDEKISIDDFIEREKNGGKDEKDIVVDLIISWFTRNEIIESSLSNETKIRLENYKEVWIDSVFSDQNFRFNNREELENKFFEIIQDILANNKEKSEVIKENFPLKRPITMDEIIKKEKEWREKWKGFIYNIDLSGEILPDLDWSKSRDVFNYLSFDDKTFSQTSKEHLPEWFDPEIVFENWKTIGLWIDDVHKLWYTWEWVSVAICDWQLKHHDDIKPIKYIVEDHAKSTNEYFHASAVSSILAWKQTGVAPKSNLYFFAEYQDNGKEYWWDDLKSALNEILQTNESLPGNEKIKIVSISGPLYWEGIEDYVKKLKESWIRVLSSEEFFKNFCYLQKMDPMWDVDDLSNYQIPNMFIEQMIGHTKEEIERQIFITSGGMTVASPESEFSYRYDYQASASWSIPVVAWYYALACQANPDITPDEFINMAREKAKKIKILEMYKDEKEQEYLKEIGIDLDTEIKVLDLKALIQGIEEEKNK